jgi:hypothetical protein
MIAKHTGQDPIDIHELFKKMFLYDEDVNSTTEKNKTDFSDYVEQIKNYAAERLNILIPDATI